MNPEQKQLVQRHLLDEGAPLSGDEYRQLRREMTADPELTRYFNDLAETRIDAAGEAVMSPRQLHTIASAADGQRERRPLPFGRLWLGGFIAAAAGAAAILALVASRSMTGGVVLRGGGSSADALPSFRCGRTGPVTSCPPGAPIELEGNLFPRGLGRPHLAVVICDARFSCAVVQRRERGRDESAVVVGSALPRPLRVFAVWTEDTLTPEQLTQAAERLRQSGLDLHESEQLPIGRARQSSTYLNP
jgi:hypothetical protein